MPLFRDPFAMPDPFGDPFGVGTVAPRPQPTNALSPEDEESLLSRIGSGALNGLGWVGGSLSKAFGGRAIRGLLGGRPEELASIIPFSDTLGITNPANEVTGAELLSGRRDTDFLSPEGIGGLGIDILTDPATYLSFGAGALTKLGTAAKKIGIVPKTGSLRAAGLAAGSPEASSLASYLAQTTGKPMAAADVAGKALGGHIGFGLPFMGNAVTADLAPLGNAISAGLGYIPGATKAANLVGKATEPIGRLFGAGFNPEMMGQFGAKGQELAPTFFKAQKVGREAGRLQTAELMRTYGAADMLADPQGLRRVLETGATDASPGATKASETAKASLESLLARRQYLGDSKDELANFFPRQAVQPELDVAQNFLMKPSSARENILKNNSVESLNRMVADPVIGTAARTAGDDAQAAAHLIQKYHVSPDNADELAKFLHSLAPERQQFGLFARDSMHDYMTHVAAGEARVNMLQELYPMLAKESGAPTSGSVSVKELLGKLGLSESAQTRAYEALEQAGKLAGPNPSIKAVQFDGMHVPREVANALGAILKPDVRPDGEFVKLVKSLIDIPSNLFRGHVTQPFPGYHERNAMTSLGWIQTVLTGSPKAALDGNQMMTDMMRGGVIKGISEWPAFKAMGKTDEEISKHAGNWLFAAGLTDQGHVADVLGHSAAPSLLEGVPGMSPGRKVGLSAVPEYLKNWLPRSLEQANPLKMRGVGGAAESKFAPAAAGEKLATVIEQTGRGGGALALLKQGYSPEMAAALTKAAHVDYSNLTAMEREVMRRLVPFYGWARGNIPFQLKEIMKNPGGLTAQAVKTSSRIEGEQPGLIPDYLGTGAIASLGKTAEGRQRFLANLGLPFEDIGNLTSAGALAGQLNPLMKFGIEQVTGRQLSSGRELSDLRPIPGTSALPTWVQNVALNSPVARYASTLRNLTNEQTGTMPTALNLLTGMRVTDVDPKMAQRKAVEQYAEDLLRRNPLVRQHSNIYVRPDDRGSLTPAELQMLQLYSLAQRNRLSSP